MSNLSEYQKLYNQAMDAYKKNQSKVSTAAKKTSKTTNKNSALSKLTEALNKKNDSVTKADAERILANSSNINKQVSNMGVAQPDYENETFAKSQIDKIVEEGQQSLKERQKSFEDWYTEDKKDMLFNADGTYRDLQAELDDFKSKSKSLLSMTASERKEYNAYKKELETAIEHSDYLQSRQIEQNLTTAEEKKKFYTMQDAYNDTFGEKALKKLSKVTGTLANMPFQAFDVVNDIVNPNFDINDPNNVSNVISDALNESEAQIQYGSGDLEMFALNSLEGVADFGAHYLLGMVTGISPIVSMGAKSGLSKYSQNRKEGYDETTSLGNALLTASMTALTEKIGVDNFTNIVTSGLGQFSIGALVSQSLSEGMEEGIEYLTEPIIDFATLGKNVDYKAGELFVSVALGMSSGAILGATGEFTSNTISAVKTRKTANQLKADMQVLKDYANQNNLTNEEYFAVNQALRLGQNALDKFESTSVIKNAVQFSSDQVQKRSVAEIQQSFNQFLQPQVDAEAKTYRERKAAFDIINNAQQALNQKGIRMDAIQYSNLDEKVIEQVDKTQKFANDLKVNVRFDNQANVKGKKIDGYYDNSTGEIVVNPEGERPALTTFVHELTHGTESSKTYAKLQELIEKSVGKDAFDDGVAEIKERYSEVTVLTDEGAAQEYVAIYLQDTLGNENFVKKLVKYDTSLASRIYEKVKHLVSTTNTSQDIEYAFMKAFRDSGISEQDIKQYAIGKTMDGIDVALANNAISGKEAKDLKKVRKYLENNIGKTFEIKSDGRILNYDDYDVDEYLHSKYTQGLVQYNKSILSAKNRIVTDLGDVIEVSRNPKQQPNRGNKVHQNNPSIGSNGFVHYDTTFGIPVKDQNGNIIDYKLYEGDLVVELNNSNATLYDIIDIKKSNRTLDPSTISTLSMFGANSTGTVASNSNLSNNVTNVNNSSNNSNNSNGNSNVSHSIGLSLKDLSSMSTLEKTREQRRVLNEIESKDISLLDKSIEILTYLHENKANMTTNGIKRFEDTMNAHGAGFDTPSEYKYYRELSYENTSVEELESMLEEHRKLRMNYELSGGMQMNNTDLTRERYIIDRINDEINKAKNEELELKGRQPLEEKPLNTEQQLLINRLGEIEYKMLNGRYHVEAYNKNGNTEANSSYDPNYLAKMFGTKIANQIITTATSRSNKITEFDTDTSFMTDEYINKIVNKAKRGYGTTTNPTEAGYMTLDGKWLDFSGKKDGGPSNVRNMDHVEIDIDGVDSIDFIKMGNIRLQPEVNGFQLLKEPTEQQKKSLTRYLSTVHGNDEGYFIGFVDENKVWNTVDSLEFDMNTSPKTIMNAIDEHFKNKNVQYSIGLSSKDIKGDKTSKVKIPSITADPVSAFFPERSQEYDLYEEQENKVIGTWKNLIENPNFKGASFTDDYGQKIILHKSPRKGIDWQLSYIGSDGIPNMHEDYMTDEHYNANLGDSMKQLYSTLSGYSRNAELDVDVLMNDNKNIQYSVGLSSKEVKNISKHYQITKDEFENDMIDLGVHERKIDKEYKNLLNAAVVEQIQNGKISDETLENLKRGTWDRMVEIKPNPEYDTYKEVKDYIKGHKISMQSLGFDERRFTELKKGIGEFAGKEEWNTFRKKHIGKFRFVKEGGTDIDTIYNEIVGNYPGLLSNEDTTSAYEQLMTIAEYLDNKQEPDIVTHVSDSSAFMDYDIAEMQMEEVIKRMVDGIEGYKAHEQAVEDHGAFKPGENPSRNDKFAKETENGKTNRFSRTMGESEAFDDKQVDLLKAKIGQGQFAYQPLSNKEQVEKANFKIEKLGLEGAVEDYLQSERSVQNIVLGEVLLNQLGRSGDTKTSFKIASKLAMELTEAGQEAQAGSILKRLTPEGRLVHVERTISKLQQSLDERYKGKKESPVLEIDEALKEKVLNATDDKAMEKALMEIADEINKQTPSTLIDKLNTWRYLSMLGNPRTHIRNMAGNAMFYPLVSMKNNIGTVLEAAAQKSGKLDTRTKSVLNPFNESDKSLIDFAKKDYEEFVPMSDRGNKYDLNELIKKNSHVYSDNNAFGRTLNKLAETNSDLLKKEDKFFSKQRYASSLAQYMKANNISVEDANSPKSAEMMNKLERAREYAYKEARKQTFQDRNKLAEAIGKLAKTNKLTQFAVDSILPFKSTPLNILKTGTEYSPVGLAWNLTKGSMDLKNGKITANEFIDKVSAGMTGTGVTLLGALLASMGLFRTRDDDKDRKQNFDEDLGEQDYALVFPHGTYTIDWASPLIMPLAIGAELYNGIDSFESIDDLVTVASKITEPIFETSMLSGLTSSLQSYSSGVEGAWNMLQNSMASYVNQYFPTLFGQIARSIDDTRRTTYPNTGVIDKTTKQIANKIPGLSYTNEPYINTKGEKQKQEGSNIFSRMFLNMVSPGYYKSHSADEYDEELLRLYNDDVSNIGVLPSSSTNKVTYEKETYKLLDEDYTKFNQTRYSLEREYTNGFIDSDVYMTLSDSERVSIISKMREYAGKEAKNQYLTGIGKTYDDSEYTKVKGALDTGIELYEYYLTKSYYNSLSGKTKKSEYVDYLIESGYSTEEMAYLYDMIYTDGKLEEHVKTASLSDEELKANAYAKAMSSAKKKTASNYKKVDEIVNKARTSSSSSSGSKVDEILKKLKNSSSSKVSNSTLLKQYLKEHPYDTARFS